MKKIVLICLIIFPCLLKAQTNQAADSTVALLPRPSALVTDYTHSLSVEEMARLENKLGAFDGIKTAQIAISIMPSTGNEDIMAYGLRLSKNWFPGYKGVGNGILILIAMNDHKAAILTGTDMEHIITNNDCTTLIQNDIIAHFKKGEYFAGLDQCIDDLIKRIQTNK